jgi:hypothetical protein
MVTRFNLKTTEILRYSFLPYASNEKHEQSLYKSEHPEFGVAEALLLTKNQIWIGMDNNQLKVNKKNKWVKQFGLKGNAPAILIFKRPENF